MQRHARLEFEEVIRGAAHLVDGYVFSADHVAAHNAVLSTDGLHDLLRQHALWNHGLEINRPSISDPVLR